MADGDSDRTKDKRDTPMQTKTSWLTGKSRTKAMDAQITQLVWMNVPYRQAVSRISDLLHLAIWVDRRLDPDASIAVQIGPKPPQVMDWEGEQEAAEMRVVPGPLSGTQVLKLLAELRNAVVVEVDDLIFLTLSETATILSERRKTNRVAFKQCASGLHTSLLRKTAVQWPDYTQPRELATQWCQAEGVKHSNIEAIPYDRIAAGDLPPLTLLDRLTLLMVQYGQGVKFESDQLRLVSDNQTSQQSLQIPTTDSVSSG